MTEPIRILIADDHPVIREALSRLLNSQYDMQVIGKAANGVEAVQMANSMKPRLVLMDFEMPQKNGAEATSEILQANSEMIMIGYSMYDGGPISQAMTGAGAATHVSKHRGNADLLSAIREYSR